MPAWATDPDTREEPTSGQKESGWTDAQVPPFNIFNWWMGVAADWLAYLEIATDELDAEKIDRDGSVTMAGHFMPDVTATRNMGSSVVKWLSGFFTNIAIYTALDLDSAARVTSNMLPQATGLNLGASGNRWDAFLRDVDMEGGSITSDLVVDGELSAGGNFGVDADGDISAGSLEVDLSPAKDAAVVNTVVAPLVPKAWGFLFCDNGTLSGADGFLDGANIASVAVTDDDEGEITVTMASAMSGTTYAVTANVHLAASNRMFKARVKSKTALTFILVVEVANVQGGSESVDNVDLSAQGDVQIDFIVFGRQ